MTKKQHNKLAEIIRTAYNRADNNCSDSVAIVTYIRDCLADFLRSYNLGFDKQKFFENCKPESR